LEKLTLQSRKILNNRVKIPLLGFGVAEIAEDLKTQVKILREAIEVGYRFFDTAQIYRSERAVGIAVRESGVSREEFFISTKILWQQKYDATIESFEESLRKLQMDYVDRFVHHWPVPGKYLESWKDMEKINRSGRARSIAVSNYEIWHLRNLFQHNEIMPVVNQLEFNPELTIQEHIAFCEAYGIAVEAFTPIGRGGRFLQNPVLVQVAKKYGKSVPQVILRWDLQHGLITVPRTSNRKHMEENADVFDFQLDAKDMAAIDGLNQNKKINFNPYDQV